MSGNVWKWTSTLYTGYPYNATDGRKDPSGQGSRVLRGGTSSYNPRDLRCAARYDYGPGYWDSLSGFRIALSSFNGPGTIWPL